MVLKARSADPRYGTVLKRGAQIGIRKSSWSKDEVGGRYADHGRKRQQVRQLGLSAAHAT